MEQLLYIAGQFPTVIYSTLLGIVAIYWLVGMLGIIDLDLTPDADLDVDVEADLDTDLSAGFGGLAGLLLTFGLTSVPFTLVISIICLISWLISIYLQLYAFVLLDSAWLYYLLGSVSTVLIFFISLPITGFLIRPLKGMFVSIETISSHNLVGSDATIATGKVTETFGQAKVLNEGAEILLDVRCDPEHRLSMGDKVLLIEYSKGSHSYIVAPFPEELL
ncbi:OB-fold-containig protein [Colwellia psychrerythraea]|uniref:DUF1449 domain-containing protein n=1 Tax=Colwellia psychrerythraea TaxID=28229 RepID=A0A099L2Z9_COLPS|nr:OB-fold-containig protein [Colwellia psychrerythraea]KGJ97344.1 hypothetical protein GAB14E_0933 [Colwellia psychrerythraea]